MIKIIGGNPYEVRRVGGATLFIHLSGEEDVNVAEDGRIWRYGPLEDDGEELEGEEALQFRLVAEDWTLR